MIRVQRMNKERYTQVHLDKGVHTRELSIQEERIMYTCTPTKGKVCISWKTKFWSKLFGPWYFDPWYWSKVSGLRY